MSPRTARTRPPVPTPDASPAPSVAEPAAPAFDAATDATPTESGTDDGTASEPSPTAAPSASQAAASAQPSGYKGLKVWQRAMDLAVAIHQLTLTLPAHEQDVLAAELRRSSIQVPSYIAAGNSHFQRVEHVQYLSAAHGAVARLESTLLLAERLGYVAAKEAAALAAQATHVGYLLRALTRALQPPVDGAPAPTRSTSRRAVPAAAD